MGRSLVAAAFLLLCLAPAAALAQGGGALFVDNSGSMKPYYLDGRIIDISRAMGDVLTAHGGAQLHAFSDNVYPLSDVNELRGIKLGNLTYIDRALNYAVERGFPIVWMVTDNVESQSSAPEAADTEVFYHKLRGAEVKKIVIFPLRQQPGTTGLVIYALQLSPAADEMFEQEVAEFAEKAKGAFRTEALRMKPLDKDTVQVSYERVKLKPKIRGAVLYKEGQDIHEEVELRFKSRFDHLKIVDAKLIVPPTRAEFGPASLLTPERRELKISPERVTVDPQNETEQVYKVTVDLGKVNLKSDLATHWKAARSKGHEDVDLNLAFIIQVPPENFKFRDDFLATYNADTPQAAKDSGRIYRLDKLPMLLSASSNEIAASSSLPFRVEYSWWPIIKLFGLGGIGLLLVLGLIFLLVKAGGGLFGRLKRWEVSAENAHGVQLDCQAERGRVLVQGDELGVISGSTFSASEGVRLDGGAGQVKLEDNLRLRVERKGRQFFLVFTRGVGAKNQSSQQPQQQPTAPVHKPRMR
jgi:hypothetical protein